MTKKFTTIDTFVAISYNTVSKSGGIMKRFLMFLVIAIAVVSLGLTIYYFSADNEVIYIKSSYLVIDQGDNIRTIDGSNDLVDFKNRSEHTTLSYSLEQNEDILEYNEAEGFFTAKVGGESKIIIKTNNRNYSRLVVDVLVCDGSEDYPYIIKSEEDLKKVGVVDPNPTDNLSASQNSYKLGNDIELTQPWTPIPSFAGTFDGNYFTINNMAITDAAPEGAVVQGVVGNGGAQTNAGFISVLEPTGVVKNLFLTNVNIDASVEYMGAFVGTNKGLVQTSEATGSIKNNLTGNTSYVGGVVGRNISETTRAKIDRCGFEGSMILTGSQQVGGGVAGQNQAGTISETYSRLEISNRDSNFGGIVGINQGLTKGTADIYDSYFYMTAKNNQTNFANIGGVTYNNVETTSRNMVTGNYNGGCYTSNEVENKTVEGSFDSSANGYLTSTLNQVDNAQFIGKTNFVTTKAKNGSGKADRTWNFETVWEMSNAYPILNVFSSVGSTYIIDVSDIITGNQITNAQEFYDVLAGKTNEKVYELANDISIDANSTDNLDGFVWGDSEHPIPESFNGTIINPNGYVVKNITINNTQPNQNVGLVKNLGSSAIISGLIIKNVTITGEDGYYVGVLAGESYGATVQGVQIEQVHVNIDGFAFGTMFGKANDLEGHGIKDVKAKYVDTTNGYYYYAGGLVGINLSTITAEIDNYNDIYHVYLVANFAGGIAGANGGKISYTSALDINFSKDKQTGINTLYNGDYDIFVGGIIGINQYTNGAGNLLKGSVADVYANLKVNAETGVDYKMYVGGVAGYNSNYIVRAYVKATEITVTGSQNVFAGGITGYNTGRISNSIVDKDSKIITSIVASLGASGSENNYILNTSNCSIVGGLVGYDAQTSNSTYSIYQCASFASQIKGYYAGGLVGISLGKIEYSYCGNSKEVNGKVSITGYMAGGIAGVVAGGFVKDCYTFCALSSAPYGGKYSSIVSAIKMEVSCMGGITVFVLNKDTIVQGCYAVVTFNGNGVSFGSSADLTGYVRGTLTNCAYQNAGSQKTPYGTQISASNLKGADGYYAFRNAMGSIRMWDIENGYPVLEGVDHKFPGNTVPVNH